MKTVLGEVCKLSVEAKAFGIFFPLVKHVIPEVLSLLLMGSALASGRCVLETSGTASARHEENFLQLFKEDTPVVTLLVHEWLKQKY